MVVCTEADSSAESSISLLVASIINRNGKNDKKKNKEFKFRLHRRAFLFYFLPLFADDSPVVPRDFRSIRPHNPWLRPFASDNKVFPGFHLLESKPYRLPPV